MKQVYTYTKKQAVEDGLQVDLSEYPLVKEAGFRIPFYMTTGAHKWVEVPVGLEGYQDYDGRLWDVLTMAKLEVKRMIATKDHFGTFKVIFLNAKEKQETVKFFIVFEPHEGFTIMLPEDY